MSDSGSDAKPPGNPPGSPQDVLDQIQDKILEAASQNPEAYFKVPTSPKKVPTSPKKETPDDQDQVNDEEEIAVAMATSQIEAEMSALQTQLDAIHVNLGHLDEERTTLMSQLGASRQQVLLDSNAFVTARREKSKKAVPSSVTWSDKEKISMSPLTKAPGSLSGKPPLGSSSAKPSSGSILKNNLLQDKPKPKTSSNRRGSLFSNNTTESESTISLNLSNKQFCVPVRSQPLRDDAVMARTIYTKALRETLPVDKKEAMFNNITSSKKVLDGKRIKLYPTNASDQQLLENTYALGHHLSKISDHFERYDCKTTFYVVVPEAETLEDIIDNPTLEFNPDGSVKIFDLFVDYASVTPEMAAASSLWYYHWAGKDDKDPSYREDLYVTGQFFHNASETDLDIKCLEDLTTFPAESRGGPLVLSLIQHHIQSNSEPACKNLMNLVEGIKISKYPGENVSHFVSIIRSVNTTLSQAREAGHYHYRDEDFVCTVIVRLQTTTVSSFNAYFKQLQRDTLDKMDEPEYTSSGRILRRNHMTPKTKPLEVILVSAESKYLRLVKSGTWNVSANSPAANFTPTGGGPPSGGASRLKRSCFNCGDPDHMANNCPKPRDDAKVAAAKAAYEEKKKHFKSSTNNKGGQSSGNRSGKPSKSFHGIPTTTNKNGETILDQKKWNSKRVERDKQVAAHLLKVFKAQTATNAANPVPDPAAAPAPAPAPTPAPAPAPTAAKAVTKELKYSDGGTPYLDQLAEFALSTK